MKNNKLSISLNCFDCEELIEPILVNIRSVVDHISIVYQEYSNQGNRHSINIHKYMDYLKSLNLVDDVFHFEYRGQAPHAAEIKKRNIGLLLARNAGCSHYISSDCDEFYFKEELEKAYKDIIDNNIKSSACRIYDYYCYPNIRYADVNFYYVPFIYSLDQSGDFVLDTTFPAIVDPTRKFRNDNCKLFDKEEIAMHHFTTIRANWNNLKAKFDNSTGAGHWGNEESVIKITHDHRNYTEIKPEDNEKYIYVADNFNLCYYLDKYNKMVESGEFNW